MTEKLSKIQAAVSQFGFAAEMDGAEKVVIRNKKKQICALVTSTGVEQKYAGAKNLCGALVRNAINSAIVL